MAKNMFQILAHSWARHIGLKLWFAARYYDGKQMRYFLTLDGEAVFVSKAPSFFGGFSLEEVEAWGLDSLCMCAEVACVLSLGQPPITVLHLKAKAWFEKDKNNAITVKLNFKIHPK